MIAGITPTSERADTSEADDMTMAIAPKALGASSRANRIFLENLVTCSTKLPPPSQKPPRVALALRLDPTIVWAAIFLMGVNTFSLNCSRRFNDSLSLLFTGRPTQFPNVQFEVQFFSICSSNLYLNRTADSNDAKSVFCIRAVEAMLNYRDSNSSKASAIRSPV